MSRWLAIVPAGGLAGLIGAGAFFLVRAGQTPGDSQALVGKPLPASFVRSLSTGQKMKLTSTLSGPTVVNVFASWCTPCQVEHPLLLKLKGDGVPIVGVAWKDSPDDTRTFLSEKGDPFTTVVSDQTGRAGKDLGVTGAPETYLVDADGKVVFKHGWVMTPADAKALEEKWRALQAQGTR